MTVEAWIFLVLLVVVLSIMIVATLESPHK